MPAALAIPAIISGGTSIIGGLIGSHAAKSAAQIQQENAQKMADMTGQAVNTANTKLGDIFGGETSQINPYLTAGAQGVNDLSSALAPGGSLTQQFAFDPSQVANTPEYKFQLQQGQQAVQNSAAAAGGLFSGGTLKGLTQFGQGLASTSYQQAYNNALNTFQTNRNNTFQGLTSLTGIGQNAVGQYNAAAQNYGNQFSNNTLQGNQQIVQALTGGANAQAAGTVGSANAWQSALGGVGNAAANYYAASKNPYGTPNIGAPGTGYIGQTVPSGDTLAGVGSPLSYYSPYPVSGSGY